MRILHNLRRIHGNQQGVTLIEVLVTIAIIGIIAPSLTMAMAQLYNGSNLSNNRNTAINNVRNAGDWISRDARMADLVSPASGFPLTLTWGEYGTSTTHTVVYSYSSTNKTIIRQYDGGTEFTVAQYILSSPTQTYDTKIIILTVTATVGSITESRTYEIYPRSGP